MDFLLIGGQPNSGKTETIARIYHLLATRYNRITNIHPTASLPPLPLVHPVHDFSAILEGKDTKGNNIKILIHSYTDSVTCIKALQGFIKVNSPDIVITSIRDMGNERSKVLSIIGQQYYFEIPLARVTRQKGNKSISLAWYRISIDNIVNLIIRNPPYNLI